MLPQPNDIVNISDLVRYKRPANFGNLPFTIYDVETYLDYFCLAYSRNDADGNEICHGVISTNPQEFMDFIQPVLDGVERLVDFNGFSFDTRILAFIAQYIERTGKMPKPATVHELGNLIISGQNLGFEARQERDAKLAKFGVPVFGNYSFSGMSDDARLSLGSMTPSLKVLEARMGSASIEETPIPFDKPNLTAEEKRAIEKYCLWDVLETRKVYLVQRDQCNAFGEMARDLEEQIAQVAGIDTDQVELFLEGFTHPEKERVTGLDWLGLYMLRSLPQSQFAERYCRIQAFLDHARITGQFNPFIVLPPTDEQVLRHPREETFSPDPCIPIGGHYQVRRWIGEGLARLKYVVHERGSRGGKPQHHIGVTKADTADALTIDGALYRVGVGGIHSVDAPGIIRPKSDEILVDLDVTSFYPALIVNLDVAPTTWPQHLQEAFKVNYKTLMEKRVALKGQIKSAKGEEKARFEALAYAYKIVLNSVYGKFRDRYSVLWSPSNTPRVTIHGQLFLLWCIERSIELGAKVVSANTDGFTILGTEAIKVQIMSESLANGFTLEETPYEAIVRESISCYAAKTLDGKLKRKGAMETKPTLTSEVKRPVVYDAVVAFLMDGVPVEQTVYAARDAGEWYKFAMMRKTSSKTTYNIVSATDPDYVEGGKVFRYLWARPDWVCPKGRSGYRLEKFGVDSPKYGDEWDIMPARSWSQVDPEGVDIARYVGKAWDIIAKILPPSNQVEYLSTQPIGDYSPRELFDFGILPAANQGKRVLSGKRFSTIQPWGNATTMGCYTGAKNNRVLVIDVDDPQKFRQFLAYEKGARKPKDGTIPEFNPDPAKGERLDTVASFKHPGDFRHMMELKQRGKLLFKVPDTDEYSSIVYLENLPPTAFNTKSRSKLDDGAGFDIFWGQGGSHPSLCGAREDGGTYEIAFAGLEELEDLPLWLWNRIESHLLPTDRNRVEVKNLILSEEGDLSLEDLDEDQMAQSKYGLDVAPVRDSDGVEFGEGYGETVSASHRGSTWITGMLETAISRVGDRLYPNEGVSVKSHYSLPSLSPHVVEIACFGKHAGSRGGKSIVALVEDRQTQEPRIIYKCFGSSCQSEQGGWRDQIQAEFDRLMEDRRKRVLERLRDTDEDLDRGNGDGGSQVPVEPSVAPTAPTNDCPDHALLDSFVDDATEESQKRVIREWEGTLTYNGHVINPNPVAQWLMGRHLVGAFHQPMGSGKGYGSAQVAVENLCRGRLTVYVAPRNAQLYGFRTEFMARVRENRAIIEKRLPDISALTKLRFGNLSKMSDSAFSQEIVDKLLVIVNSDNHVEEINLSGQLVILTNPYYLGQKGDTGKAHPFSYQLGDHSTRLGRAGIFIFDEYHDTVREAWSKSMPIGVRYRQMYSAQHNGMIPRVLSHCPAKPSGWAKKTSGSCDGCISCEAPATLRSNHGVLSWKTLTVLNDSGGEEHPFKEAQDAPLMQLGEVSDWVPISRGGTQVYSQVHTIKVGNNVNWDDSWHEGEVAQGWGMNASRWVEDRPSHKSEEERRKGIYQRDKGALSYNLRANFGIRAVMDIPVRSKTLEPIFEKSELEEILTESGKDAVQFPRNACMSPEIRWIDATTWYRMVDFIESGWKIRFLSATVSDEALDHVRILANHVEETFQVPEGGEFSEVSLPSPETMRLDEVLVIGTGLAISTAMGVVSTRRNTQFLSTATHSDGTTVPNRIAAFFGRARESENFWKRKSSRVDFHPWWGLHQSTELHIQHSIAQSSQDVSESLWMVGGERRTMEHPHIMSYLYGSLSTGANIRNLRTLIVDYSTPPPLRAHLSNHREVTEESLREDHAKAFGQIIAQVAGRALRFRDKANRAVILICGIESHSEFLGVVDQIPLGDRANEVTTRYISDPNDIMPVMYRYLNRLTQQVSPEVVIEAVAPTVDLLVEPVFDLPNTKKVVEEGTTTRNRLAAICSQVHAAVEDAESWLGFKDRLNLTRRFSSEEIAQIKLVWDETKVAGKA
jgi:hypothetical protein